MKQKTYEVAPELSKAEREKLGEYSDLIAKLLFRRNLPTNEEAAAFINADYDKHTHDPFLLKDMDKATDRILAAVKNNEKICIYSDYDADGVPGAVVFADFFKKIGYENVFVYIPHRNKEGFGLNNRAIDKIVGESEAKLIVTIDCGIADIDQVAHANSLGADVIVTDHHEVNQIDGVEQRPPAFAIVNPKQLECTYPEKMLCGSGVIFKAVQALIKKWNETADSEQKIPDGWEKWLLDIVGIATLSDMVPLTGENRVFAKFGLVVLRKSPRLGLLKLLQDNGMNQSQLSGEDVVFTITPRINAASRMGEPMVAYDMLASSDEAVAAESVKHLHKINDERKGAVAAMVREINKHVKENLMEGEKMTVSVIVKGNPNWAPSLLGLAASSLVDSYGVPAFLWGRGEGDELKGSCRSDGSASVVSMMENVPDGILDAYGGHTMAGGFVLNDGKVDDLEEALTQAYEKVSTDGVNSLHNIVDAEISVDDVSWSLADELEKLEPFGTGHEKPTFIIKNIEVFDLIKFGKTKNHARFIFKKTNGSEISAIQFFAADNPKIASINRGDKINLVAHIEKSSFGGRRELRLRVVDIM